jgi:hypothetical protein
MMSTRLLTTALLGAAATMLLAAGRASAAQTKSNLRIVIGRDLKASVTDEWSGMLQANGKFDYFSAAREHGIMPVDVKAGGFKLDFETDSYVREESGLYYLVTPDFYYPAGPIDVHCVVEYPDSMRFLDAKPAPDKSAVGKLEWTLRDCEHRFILARFEPAAGAAPASKPQTTAGPLPGEGEPDGSLVDAAELPQLLPAERPRNPDEALTEMRNVLRVAEMEHSTDPQFIRVLEKVLAKFYYLFDHEGALRPRPVKLPPAMPAAPSGEGAGAPAASDADGDGATPRFRGIW